MMQNGLWMFKRGSYVTVPDMLQFFLVEKNLMVLSLGQLD